MVGNKIPGRRNITHDIPFLIKYLSAEQESNPQPLDHETCAPLLGYNPCRFLVFYFSTKVFPGITLLTVSGFTPENINLGI